LESAKIRFFANPNLPVLKKFINNVDKTTKQGGLYGFPLPFHRNPSSRTAFKQGGGLTRVYKINQFYI
jgi:hypothetical protein